MEESHQCSFGDVPPEVILFNVLQNLGHMDLCRLHQVDTRCRDIVKEYIKFFKKFLDMEEVTRACGRSGNTDKSG